MEEGMSENSTELTHFLALILDRIGIKDFKKIREDINIRKKIQKAIYILKLPKFDFDLGHGYNLYIAGPYSPDLSTDYYSIADKAEHYHEYVQKTHFISEIESKLDEFNKTFDDDYLLLESTATIHFLYSKSFAYIPGEIERKEKVVDFFIQIKPEYENKKDLIEKAFILMGKFSSLES